MTPIPIDRKQTILEDATEAYKKGNYVQAIELLRPLAAKGNAPTQNNLGVTYTKGEGIIQDYVRAHMWFNLAASKGNKTGGEYREKVTKKMTPAQIAKAQKMARDCEKKKYKNR